LGFFVVAVPQRNHYKRGVKDLFEKSEPKKLPEPRMVSIVALLAAAVGCTTTVRSTGEAPYPRDGIHLLYSRDGRLIQKNVWHHANLVAAWQYQSRLDLPRKIVEAVNRGERDWPAPRWIQVVKNGKGRLISLDEDGNDIGFADYFEGEFWKGAH
jgi:hypothetical protein